MVKPKFALNVHMSVESITKDNSNGIHMSVENLYIKYQVFLCMYVYLSTLFKIPVVEMVVIYSNI